MLNPGIKRLKIEASLPDLLPKLYINKGKLAKAQEFFDKMPEHMNSAYEKACNLFAKQILAKVRKAIATGTPPPAPNVSWPPLAPKTLKIYEKWGYDEASPWLLLGQMLQEVNIFKNNRGRYYVGFKPNTKAIQPNPNSTSTKPRPTIAKLANMLERGGDYHPPRPLFNPAYVAAGGKERLENFILRELKNVFNSKRIW